MRAYLGLETTRGWKEATVLRLAPCLFGLFSVVAVLFDLLPVRARAAGRVAWPGKVETTFSDAITAVRRGLFKTLTPVPGDLAFSLGAACVTVEKGQKTS